MARDFADKSAARQWVWDRLGAEGVARFPFPPHGRIPNFVGAEQAAARLLDIEPWKSATAIKVNPDSPQRPLRAEALRRGITVFVPTPRLRGGPRLRPWGGPVRCNWRQASRSSCVDRSTNSAIWRSISAASGFGDRLVRLPRRPGTGDGSPERWRAEASSIGGFIRSPVRRCDRRGRAPPWLRQA